MVMNLKPLNMSALGVGFVLVILNLAVLGPMATGAVPDVVKEAVETKAKDDICNDVLCIDVNGTGRYQPVHVTFTPGQY